MNRRLLFLLPALLLSLSLLAGVRSLGVTGRAELTDSGRGVHPHGGPIGDAPVESPVHRQHEHGDPG